jgi:rubrerythrin
MQEFQTADDVLDFAIANEEEASSFYSELAVSAANPAMREIFSQFALEEQGHKAKLLIVKRGKEVLGGPRKVADLRIGDYLVEITPYPGMSYQEALIVAMKKEKAAFRLYLDLSEAVADAGLRETFLNLAMEEAKHKLRFELEYDERVLREN